MQDLPIMEAITTLQEAGLDKAPQLAFMIRRYLTSGDPRQLETYLSAHPHILAAAGQNQRIVQYQQAENPFRPYPSQSEAARSLSGPLRCGYVNEYDDLFGIYHDMLCRPLIVLGRVGSGKSVFIKYLLTQALLRQGDYNIIIPDLKKEYRHLAGICPNLRIVTIDRLKINFLEVPPWRHPLDHAVAFAKAFVSENYILGTSENELFQLVHWLYQKRGIYDGSTNYPTLVDLQNLVRSKLKKHKSFRFQDILIWLDNRLAPYNIGSQFRVQRGIPFEVFAKENLVLELDSGLNDRVYNYTTAHIIEQLYSHAKEKQLTGSKLRHWVNVDEARILFQADRDKSTFGESILNELVSKSREFGIGFSVLSQESTSINRTLRSLAYLKVAFPLNDAEDLRFIRDSFGLSEAQEQHLFKLPPHARAVVRYGGFENPFLMQVPHFKIKRQLSDQQVAQYMSGFWAKWDKHIISAVPPKASASPQNEVPETCLALLSFLADNPFTKKSELTGQAGLNSPGKVNQTLEWLAGNGYVLLQTYPTSTTRPPSYPVLTQQAYDLLERKNPLVNKSFEHALYQDLLARHFNKQGLKAETEGRLPGSNKAVDVLVATPDGRYLAYEVTLHYENLMDNIHKDIRAGASEVIIVVRDKAARDKAGAILVDQPDFQAFENLVSSRLINQFPA